MDNLVLSFLDYSRDKEDLNIAKNIIVEFLNEGSLYDNENMTKKLTKIVDIFDINDFVHFNENAKKILIKISLEQFPDLQNYPSYLLSDQPTDLFTAERNNMKLVKNFRNTGIYPSDTQYYNYINFIIDDMDWCPECKQVLCCSWCRKNKVIHDHDICGKRVKDEIKEKHKTWRCKIDDSVLEEHEYAIYCSFKSQVLKDLDEKNCLCNKIDRYIYYYTQNENFNKTIDYTSLINSFKRYSDCSKMDAHIELIKSLKH